MLTKMIEILKKSKIGIIKLAACKRAVSAAIRVPRVHICAPLTALKLESKKSVVIPSHSVCQGQTKLAAASRSRERCTDLRRAHVHLLDAWITNSHIYTYEQTHRCACTPGISTHRVYGSWRWAQKTHMERLKAACLSLQKRKRQI